MKIIKGADVVSAMTSEINKALSFMNKVPCLAIIRVGERADDISYERGAKKRMEKIGIECRCINFPADIEDDCFKTEFSRINADKNINGILLLRPLPKQIDEKGVCDLISPEKDIDCISPINIEKIFEGDETGFLPCTAAAVMKCLEHSGTEIAAKRAVVIGRSMVVGKPLSMLLLNKNATVTICHSKTADLKAECRRADILVSCMGRAKMITGDYVKDDAVVIDVGINVDADGNLCGDVDYDDVAEKTSMITPVPGGVGSVTTAILAEQLIKAAKMQ